MLDAEGNNVWGSDCYCCGCEIQDGAKGEGKKRYHCLECPRSDRCEVNNYILIYLFLRLLIFFRTARDTRQR